MPRRVPSAVHSANSVRSAPVPRSCTLSRPSSLAWPVNSAAAAQVSPRRSATAARVGRARLDRLPGLVQVHERAAHAGALEQEQGEDVGVGVGPCGSETS